MSASGDSVSSVSISGSGSAAAEKPEPTPADPNVLTKYKVAGEIAQRVLLEVQAGCVDGASVVDLCTLGDARLMEELDKTYNSGKSKCEKGIAWPTCVSVNNCLGHVSPLASEAPEPLKNGDLVKIDLGCHVDGFPAMAATSLVCGASAENPATGKNADVIQAAYTAAEVALRMLRAGNTNHMVSAAIGKVAAEYGVSATEGVLSHEMKRFIVDGGATIMCKEAVDQAVDKVEFQAPQVWSIDIVMSSGEGKSKQKGTRTTIYKRAVDQSYQLKFAASRLIFSEVSQRFPVMPFTIRALSDEKKGRMGIVEMQNHDLVHPYPVLYEKEGEVTAHVKVTAVILPSGSISRLTDIPIAHVNSEVVLQDNELKQTLERSLAPKKKKKNNKKKKKKAAAAE